MGGIAVPRNRSRNELHRESISKSTAGNFVVLGFSEVRAQNPVFLVLIHELLLNRIRGSSHTALCIAPVLCSRESYVEYRRCVARCT